MTFFRLLLRTVQYHRQTSAAVLLGVMIATAVICGALIVGDSVRESLRLMTLARLGQIDHVLQSPRFFREDLANDLEQLAPVGSAAPAISLVCGLQHASEVVAPTADKSLPQHIQRANKVNVFGVNERFWKLTDHAEYQVPTDNEVVLSQRVADQLSVQVGQDISMWLEIPSTVPRESLLGKREAGSLQLTLKVKSILPEALGLGRLGLRPNQQLPLNAFMSLKTLQDALNLNEVKATFRDRHSSPAKVNTLFVAGRTESDRTVIAAEQLNKQLPAVLRLRDLDLRLVDHEKQGYFALESYRMILENAVTDLALQTAADQDPPVAVSPSLVYVANEMSTSHSDKTFSMYSVIAGMDLQDKPPFGPYEFVGSPPPKLPLAENEIVINAWLAEDLHAKVGDTIKVKYHLVGSRGEIPEETRNFTLAGILKFEEGSLARDRGITPEVRGITDAKSLDKWDEPFPMDYKRITDRDHAYWNQFKATPKAFINLSTAQKLWNSRYGKLTSIRIQRPVGQQAQEVELQAGNLLLQKLPLEELGMFFTPVKALGLRAAGGTTDFGGLFIGFSFFLIISAAILVRLLFKLGIERRAAEVGLLQAVGWAPKNVARLLFLEGLLIVVVGSLLGVLAGIGYASLMIYGLKTWWVKAIGTKFLVVSIQPLSLILGLVLSVVVAGLSVWRAFGQLQSISVRGLLSGSAQPEAPVKKVEDARRRSVRWTLITGTVAGFLLLGSLLQLIPDTPGLGPLSWRSVAFFLGGMSSLVAGLSALGWWLDRDQGYAVRGGGWIGLARLSLRNASRNRSRSVLTVWLIASATFLIVAVAAGQRNPAVETPEKFSGNGGFTLVAESSQPILFDLNTSSGRKKLNLADPAAEEIWKLAAPKVYPFRVKPGDEASCLNIYQSQLPTVLGAPRDLIERGGFRFVGMSQPNPWTVLNERPASGTVPVLGDMNTLMYSLHKGVGVKLGVPTDEQPDHQLEIAGMFDGAVFQGVLVMSEERFLETFPEQAGYQYFLIEVAPEHAAQVADLLETRLEAAGFDAERVADRLADFLAVQNTYLSTFQTLGGLGLLLGTLGLGTVMLRNVLERRAEIALLKSIGFTARQTAILVLSENSVLLFWGLLVGAISALLAMMPHLLSIGGDFPWTSALGMLAAVAITGTLAALAAVRSATRLPTLDTLRREI